MRRFLTAALLAAPLFAATPALAQKLGEKIDVGGWKVEMASAKDGSTNCTATFVYDDKSAIGFMVDNDDTHMFIVIEPSATMKDGQKTDVTYRVDKMAAFSGIGIAVNATTLVVPIADDHDAIYAAFQKGSSLFIKLGGKEFEEPLDGPSNAIAALGTCQSNLPARKK